MTLNEAKKKGYSQFEGEKRELNLKLLDYLLYLIHNARVSAGEWDLAWFTTEDGDMLSKAGINKAFFERSAANRITETATKVDGVLTEALASIGTEIKKIQLGDAKRRLKEFTTNAAYFDSVRLENLHGGIEMSALVEKITKESPQVERDIQRALSEGFYTYDRFINSQGILQLLTPPITLTDVRPKLSINNTVHLGRFRVSLNFKLFGATVSEHEDNIKLTGGLIHPFCKNNTFPCFGTSAHAASLALIERRFYDFLFLLQQLLTTYSHENGPYALLETFKDKQDLARHLAANPSARVPEPAPREEPVFFAMSPEEREAAVNAMRSAYSFSVSDARRTVQANATAVPGIDWVATIQIPMNYYGGNALAPIEDDIDF